ncbi:MAG TPA: T9SS type A sorting domain-containing protein [Saprospiraceae bacterium]|nr:T9SS type A sorting domain-containing protein [Saprospiraceae bacterium]HMQ84839.1 T9SS type A sorting domain-containing protein [Saprospiraceae bacterium]
MNSKLLLLLILSGFSSVLLQAQNQTTPLTDIEVQVTYAEFVGKTPPLRDLAPLRGSSTEKKAEYKRNKTVPNFAGRKQRPQPNPNALPRGEDPIRQSEMGRSTGIVVEPTVNIDGMVFGTVPNIFPPDPTGDVGRDYYLQSVNATFIQVFDKMGNAVTAPISANTIWSTIGFSSAGDPIILYDQEANRWYMTEFPFGNRLLVAVSETADPTGSWNAYNFSTPNFPDYPKYALWPNALVVTTNEQGPGSLPAYFINREDLLNGEPTVMIQRLVLPGVSGGPGFQVATPVDWSGINAPPANANPMILTLSDDAWGGSAQDQVNVFSIDLDWNTPGNTTVSQTSLVTTPYDTYPCAATGFGFACIPQLGGGGIDGLPEVIMHQSHYRNFGGHEAIVLNFITDAAGGGNVSGIRWMELRRTPGNDWSVYQEGTYAPDDGLHRFMGGIAMDGAGNIGLAYSVSSSTTYAGLRFTGRRASDPLGEMSVDEYEITPGFSTNPGDRYGDYAQMSVDPADDRTFWFTGEYRRSNGFGTRIVAFQLKKDTNDIGPVALLTPANADDLSAAEPVKIQVKNFGIDTQSVFQVGYIFENGTPVIEPVNYTLAPDSIYEHTFASTVDLSVIGDYDFKIFTSMDNDEAVFNDTLRAIVFQLPRFDIGVGSVAGLDLPFCGESGLVTVSVTNYGTQAIETFHLEILINGDVFNTIDYVGNLAPGASVEFPILLSGLVDGVNNISAFTALPNGMADEITENDSFARDFDVITDGVSVRLELLTDEYPEETTWELSDLSGTVLYAGGPYDQINTLFTEEWCLDPEQCYNFTIFDAFGDGICCFYGEGNYQIENGEGTILFASPTSGDFGVVESNDFCPVFTCLLTADFDITPESAAGTNDGSLFVTPSNGTGPFDISIDGGQTFQSASLFLSLGSGDYEVVVIDQNGCSYETTVNVPLCAISAMVEVENESVNNANDGQIQVIAISGNEPIQYSINGGQTFQSSPTFSGLGAGDYVVVVQDAIGCQVEIDVTIDVETATRTQVFGQYIEVFPNPTADVARVNVKGVQGKGSFLVFEVLDANGKRIQSSRLVKYDDTYTAMVSLAAYPTGVYFIRFPDSDIQQMMRIVKQ